ncbi:MAG TPA: apolipoprotein N-acyltransferase [Dermatophilaceae bacterium]|nr:apolipoprotein N-acyltransferase [Dermatophilaceae bacterium]
MRRLIPAAASGGLLCLAFPTYDLWFMAPIALAVLALALGGTTPRRGFGLGLLAGLVFFVPTLHWSGIYVGNLPWLALATLEALFVALFGLLVAWLTGPSRPVRPLAFAIAWVVTESLRATAPYGGFPWVKLAFGQADAPFGRLAALGGASFVAFVIALTGALLALVVVQAHRRMPLARVVVPAALAVGLALVGLAVPLPMDGTSVNVVGVQGNVPRAGLDFNAERRAVLDNHVATTRIAVRDIEAGKAPKPDLVVWPENASDIDPIRNADANELIRDVVDQIDAPVMVGGLLEAPDGIRNTTLLFEPGRGDTARYVKRHPVPFGEYIPNRSFWRIFSDKVDLVRRDFLAGDEVGLFDIATGGNESIRTGIGICFEVAYDDVMRDTVRSGANLLVIQTNNATFGYTAESPQQLAISRLRAIEFGRSVVHVSTVGQSALITPDGTAHQVTSLFTQAVVRGDLPLRDATTLATRVGAVPEWTAAATLLVLLGLSVARGHRRPAGHSAPQGTTQDKEQDDDDRP